MAVLEAHSEASIGPEFNVVDNNRHVFICLSDTNMLHREMQGAGYDL